MWGLGGSEWVRGAGLREREERQKQLCSISWKGTFFLLFLFFTPKGRLALLNVAGCTERKRESERARESCWAYCGWWAERRAERAPLSLTRQLFLCSDIMVRAHKREEKKGGGRRAHSEEEKKDPACFTKKQLYYFSQERDALNWPKYSTLGRERENPADGGGVGWVGRSTVGLVGFRAFMQWCDAAVPSLLGWVYFPTFAVYGAFFYRVLFRVRREGIFRQQWAQERMLETGNGWWVVRMYVRSMGAKGKATRPPQSSRKSRWRLEDALQLCFTILVHSTEHSRMKEGGWKACSFPALSSSSSSSL